MRARLVALAAAVLVAVPGSAAGQTPAPATKLIYSGESGALNEAVIRAEPGMQNAIGVGFACADGSTPSSVVCQDGTRPLIIARDTGAGIIESPNTQLCANASPTEIRCMAGASTNFTIQSGDQSDRVDFRRCVWPLCGGLFLDLDAGDDRARAFIDIPAEGTRPDLSAVGRGGPGADVMGWVIQLQGGGRSAPGAAHGFASQTTAGGTFAILGEAGPDQLRLTGPGVVRGGLQSDRLRGGRGPQRLFGDGGNDFFSCGPGKDLGNGGPGVDRGGLGSCEQGYREDENADGDFDDPGEKR